MMKTKSKSSSTIEMASLTIREKNSNHNISSKSSSASLQISISNTQQEELVTKVSQWFDTDSYRIFMKKVKSGDILELRNSRTSHWGIAVRLKQSPAGQNGKKSELDEVMIYHLIHSPLHRGQVGQFTIEEFWQPECRIRINNTTNGMSMGKSRTITKADVLDNAFTAHMSTSLKWQTCCDFIRWTCHEDTHPYSKPSH